MVTKMFDTFFPAGPDPDPARLAIARGTTMRVFPEGTYSKAMIGFLDRTAERVLDMSEADLATMFPDDPPTDDGKTQKKKKDAKPKKAPSTEPLRVKWAKDDPRFEAKKSALKAFASTVLTKVGEVAEPKMRKGMARAMARRFDAVQLDDINAFLATPTGQAYGEEMLGMWFDNDVMRSMIDFLPELMRMAPELAGDVARLDSEMKSDKKTVPAAK